MSGIGNVTRSIITKVLCSRTASTEITVRFTLTLEFYNSTTPLTATIGSIVNNHLVFLKRVKSTSGVMSGPILVTPNQAVLLTDGAPNGYVTGTDLYKGVTGSDLMTITYDGAGKLIFAPIDPENDTVVGGLQMQLRFTIPIGEFETLCELNLITSFEGI
jgi:hypothetical protein